MLNSKTIHSVSFPAARAAAHAIAVLHFGLAVQEVSIEEVPEDSCVWLPWAAACPCSVCSMNLAEEDEEDWYPVAILAAEISALRASGRADMRSWPKIAALGDNLASLLTNETFDLCEPLESLSTYLKDQLSTPPTVSEITKTHFEVKLLWMKAVDLVCSYNDEIQELTEILDHQGYLSGEDIHGWWREINTLEYA